MQKKNKGFTLIEMLVVVLIIGILASIALPQYTNAVRKARVAEAKITLRAIVDATDRHYLNSTVDPSLDELDIEIQTDTKNWDIYKDECFCGNKACGCSIDAEPKWEDSWFIRYASTNYNDADCDWCGKFLCHPNNDTGEKICKALGGELLERYEDDPAVYVI